MSNKQVATALLKGFEGPFFPDRITKGLSQGLRRVQKRLGYHPERMNQHLFDEVAERLDGRTEMYVRTSDGYLWPVKILFPHDGRRYCVLIPMLHDFRKQDGTYADRSVAFYSMAASSEEQRLSAMTAFAKAWVSAYRAMYSNAIQHSKQQRGIPEDAN